MYTKYDMLHLLFYSSIANYIVVHTRLLVVYTTYYFYMMNHVNAILGIVCYGCFIVYDVVCRVLHTPTLLYTV